MRARIVLSTLALAAASVAVAAPAKAMPLYEPDASRAAGSVNCPAGLVGLGGDRRLHYYSIKNGRVTSIQQSSNKLSFKGTAWGFYDSTATKSSRVLQLNAVSKNGVPRRVSINFKPKKPRLSSTKYNQGNFTPRLFADGYGYYAYTVSGDKLLRWTLTRYANGRIRYAHKTVVDRGGYRTLTSLQASAIHKINGAAKEVLYGTTAEGKLLQFTVPLKNPQRLKARILATAGYAGVTEMAWSVCNKDNSYHYLIAVDPVAGRATWTTIKRATTKPKATQQGKVKRGGSWDILAAY